MGEHHGEAARLLAVTLIKDAVTLAGRRDGLALPRVESKVHKAIDLLRGTSADAKLLAIAESLSCAMREMAELLREGRVNAYDSRALRVRKLFDAL